MKQKRQKQQSIKVLGVMTGTSCDGLDASLMSFFSDGTSHILNHASTPFSPSLRKRVLSIQEPKTKVSSLEWQKLDLDLGSWFGTQIARLIKKMGSPDLISNHGQTLAHFPNDGITCQAGNPFVIADKTGLTVVSNLRKGDLAAGGHGAPLLPLYHLKLIKSPGQSIHNIGGISNFTYLGPKKLVLACDTGPGNALIDSAIGMVSHQKLQLDPNGIHARKGTPDFKALHQLIQHEYFTRPPPKSTGRDDFNLKGFRAFTSAKGNDLVATATWFTALTIYLTYKAWIIEEGLPLNQISFCGGGTKNKTLIAIIEWLFETEKNKVKIDILSNAQWIESEAFAWFGYLSLLGKPLGGSWTGARRFGSPGEIIPGQNFATLLEKIQNHQK